MPRMSMAPQLSPAERRFDARRRAVGRWLGPLVALAIAAAPLDLEAQAHRLAAIAALVVIWWITEAVPLAVTSVLGPALCVIAGVSAAKPAFAGFAHPLIFLFLGGFILARALSAHGIDRRLTLWLLSRPIIAGRPARALTSVALVAWICSM